MSAGQERTSLNPKWVVAGVVAVLVLAIGIPVGVITAMAVMISMAASQQQMQVGDCGNGQGGVVYASDGAVRLPVVGPFTYTSPFGMRMHPIYQVMRLHAGIDLVTGGGDIVAPTEGTVSSVIHGDPGAGNFVVVDHGGGITTRYLHLASVTVRVGQSLKTGQKLGVEGSTGGSTGSHLHFEVHRDNTPIDPAAWLKTRGVDLPALGGQAVAPGAQDKADDDVEVVEAVAEHQVGAGASFELPEPGTNRRNSVHTEPMPIPADIKKLYVAAGAKFGLPWQLLAGVGMEETHHGRIKAVSSAGAIGVMQFTPQTFIDFGTSADGGAPDIEDPADSIFSAANMLAQHGAADSPAGVRRAIHRYNPGAGSSPETSWYVNDVLYYSAKYGKGGAVSVSASGDDCGGIDTQMASNQTTGCPPSGNPAEKGLQPGALNVLRCGAQNAPWATTIHGVGQRAGATDHDDGLAVDFMVPNYDSTSANAQGWKLAKWLQHNARRLKITYVIFDQKIWNIERDSEGWRAMEDRGSDTENHRDHVHVSTAS